MTEKGMTTNPFGGNARSVASVSTNQQRAVAETQGRMLIARASPRNPEVALDRILNACASERLAEQAMYTYSRGGQDVTGPSIRLAEAIAQHWGNMEFGLRELEQRPGESTVEAYAWDLETNTRSVKEFQVAHIRATKRGSFKLEDPRDIYETVANQGARRMRACILAVIPGEIVEAAVRQCELTLTTKIEITPERIKNLVEKFEAYGVSAKQIEKRIQRRLDAITPAQVVQLGKLYNSIRDGIGKAADFFEPEEAPKAPAADLKERIRQRTADRRAADEAFDNGPEDAA